MASATLANQISQIDHALTAEELASFLSVAKITIYKQAQAGRIPAFRIGSCLRFDPAAIAQWLEGDKTRAPKSKRGGAR